MAAEATRGAAPFALKGAAFDFSFSWRAASSLVCSLLHPVNPYQSFLSLRVMRPTAPRPLPWMNHQFSCHRIRMHVLQFLPELLPRVNVEIVESSLPKRPWLRCDPRKRQRPLPRRTLLPFPAERSGNLLFQHLQYFRWRDFLCFAEQQVNVFRHHHISKSA